MIETDRLRLRPPEPHDRAALRAMWADPRVMADLAPCKSAAESDATLAKHDGYRAEGLGFWVTERRSDGAFVGFCGLKRGDPGMPIAGELEIGWALLPGFWGQDLAREAAEACLAYGWRHSDPPRIVAITSVVNLKSRRLMERLGMHRLDGGDFDHAQFAPGDRLRAMVTYAIERPEWG